MSEVLVSGKIPYRFQLAKNVGALLSPARNAKLHVYWSGTSSEVQLSADSEGNVELSQPLTLDEDGEAFFYLEPGLISLVIELDDSTSETIEDAVLGGTVTVNYTGDFMMTNTATVALSGSTGTASNIIPAGALVIAVLVEVMEEVSGISTIPNVSGFNVGLSDDTNAWSYQPISTALATKTTSGDFAVKSPIYIGSEARDVILSAYPEGSIFDEGSVKVVVRYIMQQVS
jgi:hypothetical protein